jgi:hypothetical protein
VRELLTTACEDLFPNYQLEADRKNYDDAIYLTYEPEAHSKQFRETLKKKDPAVGVSGLSARFYMQMLQRHDMTAKEYPISAFFRAMANCKNKEVLKFLTAGIVIPLPKTEDGKISQSNHIRPVVISNVLYSHLGKMSKKQLPKLSTKFQKALSKDGQARATTQVLLDVQNPSTQYAISFDIKNAFNSVSRTCWMNELHESKILDTWTRNAYSTAPKLVLRHGRELIPTVDCHEGVKQGDPLSMDIFARMLNPILMKIHHEMPEIKITAYAEDVVFTLDQPSQAQPLATMFYTELQKLHLNINTRKSVMYNKSSAAPITITIEGKELTSKCAPFKYLNVTIGADESQETALGHMEKIMREILGELPTYRRAQIPTQMKNLLLQDTSTTCV